MATWIDDIATLLDDAWELIEDLRPLHDQALGDSGARNRFKARVKSVLEQDRSALDYLAVGITKELGTPKRGKIYYPMAKQDKDFPGTIGARMPGILQAAPAVAAAIRKHQPYATGGEWLKELSTLTRQQKHNTLTPQIVRQTYTGRVTEKATGAYVEWNALRFEQGVIHSMSGTVEIRPNANRDPNAPQLFQVGVGPTGIMMFDVPIDPATQRPYPNNTLISEIGTIEQWCFVNPHVPVVWTLQLMTHGVSDVVKEVLDAAGPK